MTTQKLQLKHPSGKTVEIKMGFYWSAFLLGPLWALVKTLWLHFFVLLFVLILINGAAE